MLSSEWIDPLGDGDSRVELLWVAGNDLEVVNDARVSREKHHDEWVDDGDDGLINYMNIHGHWTPFAGSMAKFQIRMPIFVAREWYRHTVGFNRNEVSRRYVKSDPSYYLPPYLREAPKPGQNKQGIQDAETVIGSTELLDEIDYLNWRTDTLYFKLLEAGVAAEQARIVLPQSMYTEFRETASLAAYQRLCRQRISPDAMLETRRFAEAVSQILKSHFPKTWGF